MSLYDLLVAGRVEEFNALRGQRRRVELFASELAGAELSGVDFSGAVLEKSDLTGAVLTDANLSRADLSGIDAAEAKLNDAMGVGIKLRDAILENADLSGADFSHGDLAEAVLTRTRGPQLRLVNARLREIEASDADWPESELTEARLHKANLTRANLERADLSEATANEANLTEANLSGCIALRARLQQANLHKAKLVGARLEEANLQDADLTEANLERADLRRANLTGAKLVGAVLRGANLADAVLEGVDLAGVDLSDADLTGLDPRLLGLSADQLDRVAAVGASAEANAPLRFSDVAVARSGSRVAVFWENLDSEQSLSLRFVVTDGTKSIAGVLPISAEGVLARAILPAGEGFLLSVLQERPNGATLARYTLSGTGELGTPKTDLLGYEPGVRPVVRLFGGVPLMWGLSRRGPSLVVQRLLDGIETVSNKKVPTARGFLGGEQPLLACKGGVVIPVGAEGAGAPLRTPGSYPGALAAAVPDVDGTVITAWAEPVRGEDEPGGVRVARLGPGVTPKPRSVSLGGRVGSLDAAGGFAAWVEAGGGLPDGVYRLELPDGSPVRVPLPAGVVVEDVRFAIAAEDDQDRPLLALTTDAAQLVLVDLDGNIFAAFGEP